MAYIEKRVSKDGKVRWRALVRRKGHPSQTATFDRKTDARNWAEDIESAIRRGRYFPTSHAKRHTVSDLIKRYLDEVHPRKPNATRKSQLEWWKSELGDCVLSKITVDLIDDARRKLLARTYGKHVKKEISPTTANRYVSTLSAAFTVAVKDWRWLQHNPVPDLRKLEEPDGRVRFLDEEELDRLLTACTRSGNAYLHPIVVLALSVGSRKANIANLEWKDVDLQRKLLIFPRTKSGRPHRVPIRGLALKRLKKLHKDRDKKCPYVFPNPSGEKPVDFRSAWERALRIAEIEDFRFHDLRHSCASFLAMNGAGLHEIAEVLGHSSLEMTRRYAHLTETRVGDTVERMNKKILGG